MFLVTDDDIIICDPEAEYGPLVERLHGQVIKISPTSPHYINPVDLNLNYSDDENPLSLKSDFILSLCELIVGGKDGLMPVEKTIIDRCVRMVYRDYLSDPVPENMPILEDLYIRERRKRPAPSPRRGISAMAAGGMGWSASVPATVTPTYGKRRCGKSRSCLCNFSMTCPKPLVFCI